MHRTKVDPNNVGLKCCGIEYANVGFEELNAVAKKLRKNRNVHQINCDCDAEDYNLQFRVIANDYSEFEQIVTSHCNFDVKYLYGYFSVLSDTPVNYAKNKVRTPKGCSTSS